MMIIEIIELPDEPWEQIGYSCHDIWVICALVQNMSGTYIGHIMRASVRPCLGHDIGIEMRAIIRHVWDMHRQEHVSV
ncbi:1-deoxy-D-xylulose 5-phosphate reductoisomerase [Gossypium arboreum]|uniref:1-deoxy-D-xylulose 5-phosphate reductoisomerase n=1 Tax=Gossypium arboreum TaxID=29729 RepID=A0A0B0NX02_GOSAR|nr:1-deoxy-D-xylulose 5-phosphate reductoisomerase [Gossypium arboreum]